MGQRAGRLGTQWARPRFGTVLRRRGGSKSVVVQGRLWRRATAFPWLALTPPPRTHFLVLDPQQIPQIAGPRYVQMGGGVEYILPNGFPATAVVNPPGIPVTVR